MRRTYRSKKETSGALDPKDVLLTMDDKSSAFDAYYIQNIKQTKKEMSSVHLHAGYNKVRKRKYVKRIVKDVEPVHRESALESVYLTPNKSLRVNKPLDPFDQLLNSPSTIRNHCLSDRNGDIFSKIRKERKTYTKRNLAKKIKKYNCSSSDSSESDKENSTNETKETSNILMHQLLIEKDDKTSPKHFDRSISQLVQKLTVLKKFDNQSTSGGFSELNFSRNRLTTSIQSPKLRNSPLCSTPLKEKYRGASIYNFSPINFTNNLNNRRNCMDTTDEKNNNSSLFVKCNINKFENDDLRKEENLPDEFVTIPLPSTSIERHNDKSAVTETSINCIKSPIERYNDKSADIETSDDCIKPASSKRHNDIFAVTETSDNCIKLPIISSETSGNVINNSVNVSPSMCEKESINVTSIVKVTSKEVCEVYKEKNAMQYSKEKSDSRNSNSLCEEDPLDIVSIGNAADEKNHESYEDIIQNSKNELNSQVNNSVSETSLNTMVVVCKQIHENCKDDFVHLTNHSKENFKISSFEVSSLQTTELEPFLGFLIDNQETELNKEVDYKECNSNINVLRDDGITCNGNSTESSLNSELCESKISFSNKSLDKSIMLCTKGSRYVNFVKRDIDNLKPDDSQLSSKVSSNEQSEDCNTSMSSLNDDMSMYDTCDSGQSFQNTSEILFTKEPVVVLEKMNDSAFRRYYEKMDVYETEGTNSSYPDTDHYGSFDENTTGNPTNDTIDNNDNTEENNDLNSFCEISDDDDTEANSNGNCEEDRCISYVTTRRRNEITNDSMIFDFNDSYDSRNSLDCDKTVLSNNKYSINVKCELTDVEDLTLVNNSPVKETINILTEEEYPQCPNPGSSESNVMTGRNSRTLEFSVIENSIEPSRNSTQETKPSIVLQPGKKWERSLSIYRRMTMMTDHFDHSILDDEPMHRKGRKYRQSVISTMEMQDISDSLHNDSIKSRRSTFVSKPCRSSIKIVKQPNCSRLSLSTTTVFDDLKGFLTEVCDDTIIELSKLSIADSEHEVTVLENFHDTAGRVSTPRDYVLRRCNQTDSILFDECYPDTVLKNCRKIGEGVYGEVFLWRAGDGRVRVMKIVPIAGTTKVNGEHQKDFHEIISEIVIAMELSALRAPIAEIESHFDEGKDVDALDLHSIESATDIFNEVLAVRCVYGSYPSRLLDLWELYDETKGSENDSPAILPLDQQYIVLELANAGQDLESYQFNSAEQAHALFLQVAYGLAVGEESFQFEHRDLHWGNVLIAPTDQKFATFVFRGRAHRVPRCGVAATIIDYSLSRLSLPLSPHAAAADSAALYNDLSADDGLFDARGDYQFEVYRLMRDKLGNDWKNFEPYTNILWLHYTVDKMITALRYKRTNTKIHKHYIAKLKGIKNRILDYGSAAQFVLTDIEF